jgi:predicted 3-demethylubiquinone-9 3-methyltransferase (glyoxalase superfamily)
MSTISRIIPCLWYDGAAEEAAKLYTSLFPDSHIDDVMRSPADNPSVNEGAALVVRFTIAGQPLLALNGGPQFKFTEALSLQIDCTDQSEVDHYWEGLVAGGGEHGQCGWLKDRFGLSWQVIPREMQQYLGGPDPDGARRAMQAMLEMEKLVIADLRKAYEGA